MRSFAHLLPILFLFLSCSKNKEIEKENELPVITLLSPVGAHVYSPGQVIKIGGTVTDNKAIAEVHVLLYNNFTGSQILHAHSYPNGDSTSFDYDIPAVTGTDYKAQVIAIDRSRNETHSAVEFSCN